MNVFQDDDEAAEQTERDGIKIIHDMEFNDENSAAYIDTPENRELLKDLALQEDIMNLYDGCESNKEIIYGFTSLDFYDKLEKRQNEILSQGKKVVFVESNTSIHAGARVVIYSDKIPEIMQNYKYRYVKINGKWTRNSLLGYCDCCGMYTELVCLSNKGRTCENCSDWDF